ncbi:rhodanese-like domain-containing protein [Brevibacterium atlanticum]|uniref:rhodanese-like domain-containing protein n=1 Tax=Brevibacterium atlanticum TaxID=2697563 RepID=UPI0014247044|nr:rhodanese-like domain-containing protein [Brevibacterium atlanticum]
MTLPHRGGREFRGADEVSAPPGSMGLLARARAEIDRLTPTEAHAEQQDGAIIVDVRTEVHRDSAPSIPGSLAIDLTVLPWRLDPSFDWAIPEADSLDRRWILICRHGYSSSLAAWNLAQMGLTRVVDVIGGFDAWKSAGLPTTNAPPDRRP